MTNVSILKRVTFICFSALFAGNVFAAASVNDRPDTSSSFMKIQKTVGSGIRTKRKSRKSLTNLKTNSQSSGTTEECRKSRKGFLSCLAAKEHSAILDLAIDNPIPENVRAFLLIQRIMLIRQKTSLKRYRRKSSEMF